MKSIKELLDLQRNDGCPCGSGKKYKKCCQNEVEKHYFSLTKEDYSWLSSYFRQTLALICGLRADEVEEEIIPEYSDIQEALDELDKQIFSQEDKEAVNSNHDRLKEKYVELLKNDTYFHELRIGFQEALNLLTEIHFKFEKLDKQAKEYNKADTYYQTLSEWLNENVDDKYFFWFFLTLLNGMRKRQYTLEERTALLLGLNTLADGWLPTPDNTFWLECLRITLDETFDALNWLEDEEKLKGENLKKMDEKLEQNPTLRREIKKQINTVTDYLMKLISQGRLILNPPPYAVMGGLLVLQNYFVGNISNMSEVEEKENNNNHGSGESDHDVEESVSRLLHETEAIMNHPEKGTIMNKLAEALANDFGFFMESVRSILGRWLETEGEKEEESARQWLEFYKNFMGSSKYDRKFCLLLYLYAALYYLKKEENVYVMDSELLEKTTGMKKEEFFTGERIKVEGIKKYAANLEKEGNAEAANLVKGYVEKITE